jgi:hypothetical protein
MILSAPVSLLAKNSTERLSGNHIRENRLGVSDLYSNSPSNFLTAENDMHSRDFVEKRIKEEVDRMKPLFDW